ncbi:MAG: OmpA family protein [Myxococcales bacterium]|nr:OmpA family protein [Myxococcales bacterium]
MTRAATHTGVVLVAALWLSCAPPPKPRELVTLQKLRAESVDADMPATRPLLAEAKALSDKAVAAWQDGDLDDARQAAYLGAAKLRLARAMARRLRAEEQSKKLAAEVTLATTQKTFLRERLEDLDEHIRVYEDLAKALLDRRFKEIELDAAQQRIKAQQTIDAASAALKRAASVDAEKHAARDYTLAQQLIGSATDLLRNKKAKKATKTAELAKAKADKAFTIARVRYLRVQRAAEIHRRNEALTKEAEAIAGLRHKLETKDETQRLVLTVPALFPRNSDRMNLIKLKVVNAVVALLRKHPNYQVIVAGYTSAAVKRKRRYELSRYRAYRVVHYFQSFNLPRKRFAVRAYGAENRIARAFSADNDRVDIILLLPAEKLPVDGKGDAPKNKPETPKKGDAPNKGKAKPPAPVKKPPALPKNKGPDKAERLGTSPTK